MIKYIYKLIFIILKMLDNIKSKLIMSKIFSYLKNKRKLIISKINKSLLNRLNKSKNDFQIYQELKDFNSKYNTKLEDIDIKKIYLYEKQIGNEGLKNLCEINFKGLYELSLGRNKISDLNSLEKLFLKDLKKLNLEQNSISDISIFVKINFDKLEKLDLSVNQISDINILEKVILKEIKELNLI